ncbi:MAG: hypothetical protein WAL91_02820 [Propionicimonas sp.]
MTKSVTTGLVALLAVEACALSGVPATATAAPASVTAEVVTNFVPGAGGAFAESTTADGHGGLIVSLTRWGVEQPDGSRTDNVGQLYRVDASGAQTAFGPRLKLGGCSQFMGVTLDHAGRVFVAVGNFDPSCGAASPPSGVLEVGESSATRVLTMPSGTFANGLAIHGRTLYVTDSSSGSVWSGPADQPSAPTVPWFRSARLAPTAAITLGANGIAYRSGVLYVTGYARGVVLAVRMDHTGRPTKARVVARHARLVRADGIAFGSRGRLFVTVNPPVDFATMTQTGGGALVVINRRGRVSTVPTPANALDYPTQPVRLGGVVYVANGAYVSGTPSVVRFARLG